MDQKIVDNLEREIEDAIRRVFAQHPVPTGLPLLPSSRTIHLMAKAAVAVYEAAEENYRPAVEGRNTWSGQSDGR